MIWLLLALEVYWPYPGRPFDYTSPPWGGKEWNVKAPVPDPTAPDFDTGGDREMKPLVLAVAFLTAGTATGGEHFFTGADIAEVQLDAGQQPTPWSVVGRGLNLLKPKPHEVLVDFGCGDARWLIEACKYFGTLKAIGLEIDPEVAELARRRVAEAGLSDKITIITTDSTMYDVRADIGVGYMWREVLAKLRPKIERLDRFVAYAHEVPGLPMKQSGDLFLYERQKLVQPKPALVAPVVSAQPVAVVTPAPVYRMPTQRVAYWGGRAYTRPVCNRPGCTMCAKIRAQLYGWY